MTRNRLNMVIALAAMVVVAVAGFFVGVQPQLAQAAADHEQQTSVDAQNRTKAAEVDRLREQAKSLPKLRSELERLTRSVPGSASMSSFYASVNSVAQSTGVTVSSITTEDAVPYSSPAAATTGTGATDAATPAATASPSATPDPSATAAPGASATGAPSISASDFSAIPVSVSVDGSFDQALDFVGGMQSGGRLFLINAISSTAAQESTDGATPDTTTWTFGGFVYVLSDPASAQGQQGTDGATAGN